MARIFSACATVVAGCPSPAGLIFRLVTNTEYHMPASEYWSDAEYVINGQVVAIVLHEDEMRLLVSCPKLPKMATFALAGPCRALL